MGSLLIVVGLLLVLAAAVTSIMILIDAFQNEIWKGLVGLIFPLYMLYYALFEYDHDHKWPIVLTSLLGGGAGGLLMSLGLGMTHAR